MYLFFVDLTLRAQPDSLFEAHCQSEIILGCHIKPVFHCSPLFMGEGSADFIVNIIRQAGRWGWGWGGGPPPDSAPLGKFKQQTKPRLKQAPSTDESKSKPASRHVAVGKADV